MWGTKCEMLASIPIFLFPLHWVLKESIRVGRDTFLIFIVIFFYFFRHLWAETGGDCPLWEEIWEPPGSHVGGAVRGLHPAEGAEGRGALPAARPGQPCQGAPGCLWLWREAIIWQVDFKILPTILYREIQPELSRDIVIDVVIVQMMLIMWSHNYGLFLLSCRVKDLML